MREFIGPIPRRISKLPVDKRGFPVPWFVQWLPDEHTGVMVPHFPIMSSDHLVEAIRFGKCWICGEQLGGFQCFVIGPMCVVNRVSAEPPSHLDCARFAALNCPFLANPRVKRGLTNAEAAKMGSEVAGIMIERNPGVTAIWITKSHKRQKDGNGVLFRIGPAINIEFYAHGRRATRAEVDDSVNSGLPILRDMAAKDDAYNRNASASTALGRQIDAMWALVDGVFVGQESPLGRFGDHVSGGPSPPAKQGW